MPTLILQIVATIAALWFAFILTIGASDYEEYFPSDTRELAQVMVVAWLPCAVILAAIWRAW